MFHVYLPQMMMQLVKSSWALHLSCNKRRVAPIAALLSAILHPATFPNLEMHQTNEKGPGPLKWVSFHIFSLLLYCFLCNTFFFFFFKIERLPENKCLVGSRCCCCACMHLPVQLKWCYYYPLTSLLFI